MCLQNNEVMSILPPIFWQQQIDWSYCAKWPKNYFTHDVSHKKSALPNQKIFFRIQSTRLADLFEPLNSSLAQSAEELGRW